MVEHPGSVVVVPALDPTHLLLIRQFRYAAGETLWELPAGGLEPGEDPEPAAFRKVEEETGYRATSMDLLAEFYPSPGFSSERMWLYLAGGLEPARQALDADEQLTVHRVSLAQAEALVGSGEIRDAKTIIGILLAAERLRALRAAAQPGGVAGDNPPDPE